MNYSPFDATVNIPHTDPRDDCGVFGRNHKDFIHAASTPRQIRPGCPPVDGDAFVNLNCHFGALFPHVQRKPMALSVKDPEADRLAREVATRKGDIHHGRRRCVA